jgi:hypothetical protein
MKVIFPKDVAQQLHKSLQWVYRNAKVLGAARIEGSWIFTEESLEAAIALKREQPIRKYEEMAATEKKRELRKEGATDDPYGLLPH